MLPSLRKSRKIKVGNITLGADSPIAVQSMCATKTTDITKTLWQIRLLKEAGADIVRIAIDSQDDVKALKEICKEAEINLSIDLQENYRLAADVAPFVQKIRYNPGHLHHHQKNVPVKEKIKFLVDVCGTHDCALRIGVNFGSLDPAKKDNQHDSQLDAALSSALEHVGYVEGLGFNRFVVSLKSSDPLKVVEIYKRFYQLRPDIPLHLGVTEAGLLPDAEIKTRIAFEQLLALGIGDTVRVSLTLEDKEKFKEIEIAKNIINDVAAGRFRSVPDFSGSGLNVISCPSCSRVENQAFVQLAQKVKEVTAFAKEKNITIAVMGCRVNGPGETDHADLGLWCGPNFVNLKRGPHKIGAFKYDEVIDKLLAEMAGILQERERREHAQGQ